MGVILSGIALCIIGTWVWVEVSLSTHWTVEIIVKSSQFPALHWPLSCLFTSKPPKLGYFCWSVQYLLFYRSFTTRYFMDLFNTCFNLSHLQFKNWYFSNKKPHTGITRWGVRGESGLRNFERLPSQVFSYFQIWTGFQDLSWKSKYEQVSRIYPEKDI